MRRFIEEYLVDRNGTQAAIRAGYSKKTANEIAAENLAKPSIRDEIKKREAQLQEKTGINQEWVLKNWKHLAEYNAAKIQVPHGSGENTIVHEVMRDANVAQRATDSAAKHFGMFTEKVEIAGKDGKELFTAEERIKNAARKTAFILSAANRQKSPNHQKT